MRASIQSRLTGLVDVGKQIQVEPSGAGTRRCTSTSSPTAFWTSFASRTFCTCLIRQLTTRGKNFFNYPYDNSLYQRANLLALHIVELLTTWTPSVWPAADLQSQLCACCFNEA